MLQKVQAQSEAPRYNPHAQARITAVYMPSPSSVVFPEICEFASAHLLRLQADLAQRRQVRRPHVRVVEHVAAVVRVPERVHQRVDGLRRRKAVPVTHAADRQRQGLAIAAAFIIRSALRQGILSTRLTVVMHVR